LEILEYCDTDNLLKREQYYLDNLKPEYNILKIAGSVLGFKHSESTKKLLRITRLGRLFSETTRLKISANNHKSIPVILTSIKTGNITKFLSISKAAQFLGVSGTTVRKFIKLNKSYKGYTIVIE
jgi:NUMOD1 domain